MVTGELKMRNQISIYNMDISDLTDVEVIKAMTKHIISESEKLVCETYDEEPESGEYFYDNRHLGYLENFIDEICDILESSVTYKPHLKLIRQIRTDLYCGSESRYKPHLVEMVINDFAYQYFVKDEKVLDRNDGNCKYHYSYIVRKLRPMTNKLAKIVAENEIDSLFNRRGW